MIESEKGKKGEGGGIVRVGRIRYSNVAPVYYGFDCGMDAEGIRFVDGTPAELNRSMAAGEIDVGPVSSFAYAMRADEWLLLPELSISCFGPVMSVLLASRMPMGKLDGRRVLTTDESASGAALLRLLFAWNRTAPRIETGRIDWSRQGVLDADAFLVIGNAALTREWPGEYRHVFDLGEIWRRRTGLPFVFAVWAARKEFVENRPESAARIRRLFVRSRDMGLGAVPEICRRLSRKMSMDAELLARYFRSLRYDLDAFKLAGLRLFFESLAAEGLLSRTVEPSFFDGKAAALPDLRDRGLDTGRSSFPANFAGSGNCALA